MDAWTKNMDSTSNRIQLLCLGFVIYSGMILIDTAEYSSGLVTKEVTIFAGLLVLLPGVVGIVSPQRFMDDDPSWVIIGLVWTGTSLLVLEFILSSMNLT